ncbi:hypothetical protein D6833_12355 [Candidatus Parcubacteria bacterium]|nr:MAG: hypothetical protein D6833_12355 [Candidatus Parcubacteria bacterium]
MDWPQLVPLHAIEQTLERLERGYYITAHIPFSEQLAALLRKMGLKTLLIVRDPRDVVVSHAKYIARTPAHFLYEEYSTLSEPEQIMRSIEGVQKSAPNAPVLLSILDRYQSVLPWISESFNYTVRFERLIGPHGGGSRDAQIEELKNIARHLKIRCSSRDIEQIAAQIFGGTHTFRKGVISDWRNHFSEEHKRVFKEIAGQLLIDLGYEQDYDW